MVTSIVDQLELAGYVRRSPDQRDARARLVAITERGQELVDLSRPVITATEEAWTRHLGCARVSQLRGILTSLAEITDPLNGAASSTRNDSG